MFINKKSQPQGITKNKMKEKEKKKRLNLNPRCSSALLLYAAFI
jgi:hypothetical protein